MNFAGLSYLHSSGGVVLDQAGPLQNVSARIDAVAPYYGRTFGAFGRQAAAFVVVPFTNAFVEADVQGARQSRSLTGLGDPGLRLAVNLAGGPALTPKEFFARKPGTSLGASLAVTAPLGQYDSARLANLGTNRWSFKPELGVSHPAGDWTFEAYAGVWLFTDNPDFFGGRVRRQEPLFTSQVHVVYSVRTHAWLAGDFGYYTGGTTTVSGKRGDDRQDNMRAGVTLSLAVTKRQSVKFGYARTVSARVGSTFTNYTAAYQIAWW